MTARRDAFLRHLERHLGGTVWRWTRHDSEFEIRGFRNVPVDSAVTFVTVGLRSHDLALANGRVMREELLFSCYERYLPLLPADLLFLIGGDLLRSHKGLMRGEVLGPAGPLLKGVNVEALLCMEPLYFEESFGVFRWEQQEAVILALMPLTSAEAEESSANGWRSVEERILLQQPDLLDLDREDFLTSGTDG